ncbi:hypothetical protein [Pseudonocardia oroxyli]|uniref:Uncharacterized protein n=1 Tax=Pseudonocardia oroxyli TaxID=366584 RepID=A0A1G7UDT9_PSEOR|nr:hypothetical protein [Pseudonocardia oroxyli]SDG45742.1 hypothetical protein SAMN05216377_11219 [Pseudonocardia oroxyli]
MKITATSSDSSTAAGAVEEFVNEMDAVRELMHSSLQLVPQLDNMDAAFEIALGQALPQTSTSDRRAAIEKWQNALDELQALLPLEGEGVDAEQGDGGGPDHGREIEILNRVTREVGNLLNKPTAIAIVISAWRESVERPLRTPLLLSALLTTAVSGFEVLISRLARSFYALKPEALRAGGATYTLADIEGFATIDEFREFCADRSVDSLMFGGLDEWVKWFEKNLNISWNDFAREPDDLREVFQRRHLVVHNGGVVNRQYLLKTSASDAPALGVRLFVGPDYVTRALDLLTLAGVLLGIRLLRKLDKSNDLTGRPADDLAYKLSYRFLLRGRYSTVEQLVATEHALCTDQSLAAIMQVNGWVARKELYGLPAIKEEVQAWQTLAMAKRFRLAQDALLDKNEDALRLGLELRASGEMSTEDWMTWPMLRGVREYEAELNMQSDSDTGVDQ